MRSAHFVAAVGIVGTLATCTVCAVLSSTDGRTTGAEALAMAGTGLVAIVIQIITLHIYTRKASE